MKTVNIEALVRKNIRDLKPYSSARSEYGGIAEVFLDANESPYPNVLPAYEATDLNRYPDPLQKELKKAIGNRMTLDPQRIFLGNGSDEAIDLLFRAFCEPGLDRGLICSPTYGMYQVSAGINGVDLVDVPLKQDWQPDIEQLLQVIQAYQPKLVFLCSPNNPTGNAMDRKVVEAILKAATGLVVVDEAYGDFAPGKTFLNRTGQWPNLVVLRTFSKAWGMAGLRLGMAVANPETIAVLNKIKPPYNVSSLVQEVALEKVNGEGPQAQVNEIIQERGRMQNELIQMEGVVEVLPSDANFLLVRFEEAGRIFRQLRELGTIVRDRRQYVADALRLTVGTPLENQVLLQQLNNLFVPDHSIH